MRFSPFLTVKPNQIIPQCPYTSRALLKLRHCLSTYRHAQRLHYGPEKDLAGKCQAHPLAAVTKLK